jgi:metallo-beta-lactamase class B
MSRAWMLAVAASSSLIGHVNAAAIECSRCEAWNKEQAPFQIYGNTYYVGPHGLSSVLITSPQGHVLIDGALPQSAVLIAKHVEQLGFKMSDVKVILNSHTHYDHAGGIAELQKLTGARVIASDKAAPVLSSGRVGPDDPQVGHLLPFPAVANVVAIGRGQSVEVGPLKLSMIHTPGHAPGGTSWRWQSCEAGRCVNLVYSDSLNAVSDDAFKYGGDPRYPTAASDLTSSIAAIAAAPCDVLITAHPDLSALWEVVDESGKGDRSKLIDSTSCRHYADGAKQRFDERLASESKDKK